MIPNISTVILIIGLAATEGSPLKYLAANGKAAPIKAEQIICTTMLNATTNITWKDLFVSKPRIEVKNNLT